MSWFKSMKWSPSDYSESAVIAGVSGREMLSRLQWMTLKPKVILDVGCATGEMSELLRERYPDAQVLAIDMMTEMLRVAKRKTRLNAYVCADAIQLPLRSQCVDLIFVNFLLPWLTDFSLPLREWRRVLRSEGLLMLTALGPDTLKEWRGVLLQKDLPQMIDMHDIGDLLLQEGFADPVLDVSSYTLTYRQKEGFIHELRTSGMWFPQDEIANGTAFPDGNLDVTYEVIYAHAFAPVANVIDGVTKVPLHHLRKQLREIKG